MESHNLISREAMPRQFALRFFQTLANRAKADLETAVDWVESATITLSLTDCAKNLVEFAEQKGTKITQPESILEALFSLEGLRYSLNWSGTQLVEYLTDDAKKAELIPKDFDGVQFAASLDRFFAKSEKLERTLRAQRVYDGLLPNYQSCSSLVEFRPVFDEAREHLVNGIITATLTIEMRSDQSNADLEKVSVQLDATDIEQMLTELDRMKRKLRLLKEFAETGRNTILLNPSRSLRVE